MPCESMALLVQPYLDGELDVRSSLEVKEHLESCAGCAQFVQNHRLLKDSIRASTLSYAVPADLTRRLSRAVRNAEREDRKRAYPVMWNLKRVAWCGSAIAVFALAFLVVRRPASLTGDQFIMQEALDSHVRSMQVNHLADVASTDRHTVKPWFAGRLDYSPPVEDLKSEGFPLTGGRLDYLNNRPVSALVFHRHKHIINLFIWPDSSGDTNVKSESQRGYHVQYWTMKGMKYWAISDVNPKELGQFADLYRAHVRDSN